MHAIAHVEHERDVVVDQQDAGSVLVGQRANDARKGGYLRFRQPGGGLVEQDEAWLRGKRTRNPEPALVALGEREDGAVGERSQPEQLEQGVRALGRRTSGGARAEGSDLTVVAGDGAVLRIVELQPEGRRVMQTREFLAGRRDIGTTIASA